MNKPATATRLIHVFRKEQACDDFSKGEVWIYKGDFDPQTEQTTFGPILPADRIGYQYPEEDSDVEGFETAEDAGLTRNKP